MILINITLQLNSAEAMRGLLTESRPEWVDGKRIPSNVGSPHIDYIHTSHNLHREPFNQSTERPFLGESNTGVYDYRESHIPTHRSKHLYYRFQNCWALFEVLPQIFVEFPMRIYIFELRNAATNQSTGYNLY